MFILLTIGAAAFFQIAAAVLAVRVLRVTGKQPAWLLIAVVALVMAVRRALVLYRVLSGDPSFRPDPTYELLALAVSLLMAVSISRIGPYFVAIQRAADELRQRSSELADRVRELNCLYAVSTLVEEKGDALDDICRGAARLIVNSLRWPNLAAARIVLGEQSAQTANFVATSRQVACDVRVHDQPCGRIVVCYADAPTTEDADAFRPEERRLIQAVAERLGRVIERIRGKRERAALQEQLHVAQKMEAVGQLSCGVAHDFDNLITVVLGHVDAARATLTADHPAHEALDTVAHAADQARSVTKGLLQFGGRLPTQKEPLDLRAAVEQATHLLRRSLPASIELVADLPDQTPVWVNADPTQLQQIILNLALNARDAMPAGGTLRLAVTVEPQVTAGESPGGARPAQSVARLIVSDTGVGMTPDVLGRVFEPFFTTKQRGQGTGLGLAIVHALVVSHGGRVAVESQPGAGATFTTELPCITPGVAAPHKVADTPAPPGHGELVLIAEDYTLVRELLVSVLRGLEYNVLAVETGPALLEQARQHRADAHLLIVDVDLPGRNGLNCLRELRAEGVAVPAIVITAETNVSLDDARDGDTVLLRKPFDMRTFGTLVHELLAADTQEKPH